ncbi:glutamate-1-semialdehyde 2,1-aminomutase [Ruminiclostridium hungatei]|uniref:Glutamate-1-semialdehyde 2,1-aminomutase n=1 Tax=Ruminiclostridium hungatei TaxID=48256 RepID=A0A1V4SEP8_RUMHU|nr:glutamate-1-semialdehyde 2,1-aminomutase [Ruminiclostridium hungatei]OPX42304.1 glutamate-1-semialdehyde 2,1-aminomutase [Ruminiclostridium hungatei]
MNNFFKSKEVFDKSCKLMPGGVNSPVRAYRSVGLVPPVVKKGKGSRIFDLDGNEYIDYVCSWGPMILGHAHPQVIGAIKAAAENGTSFGAPTENELLLAELISDAIPSMEMLRLVSSGTEAAMSAIRAARGYTGRDLVVKFEGCYHGHSDGLLVKAGSGALTAGVPDSAGIPADYSKNTIVAEYNNIEGLEQLFKNAGNNIAAVIIEPVAANMGLVLPETDFLKELRSLTGRYGSLLIFDEVITGFRMAYGGAQELFGIKPDLTVLGKIIGGGMPVGAYGGRREIMEKVAPLGPVYQAGTLSGNPVAVAAGISTLSIIKNTEDFYRRLDQLGQSLQEAYEQAASSCGIDITINRLGSLMSVFFTGQRVADYDTALKSDLNRFKKYFSLMLEEGIYIAPSQFEALFISYSHTEADMEKTRAAIKKVFSRLQ